jgi:mono/diheme cytochrome c family protein
MQSRTRFGLVVAALGSLLVAFSMGLSAQTVKREAARPIGSIEGVDTFKAACSTCHGTDAKARVRPRKRSRRRRPI